MKAYKGFDKDMKCRGKQYEEGKDYKEDQAQACSCGMHACEYPLDCFGYYPPGSSVYHEVEQNGVLSKNGDDTKVASTEMHIGARLDIAGIVKAAIEYTKSRTTTEHTDPELATAGNMEQRQPGIVEQRQPGIVEQRQPGIVEQRQHEVVHLLEKMDFR